MTRGRRTSSGSRPITRALNNFKLQCQLQIIKGCPKIFGVLHRFEKLRVKFHISDKTQGENKLGKKSLTEGKN